MKRTKRKNINSNNKTIKKHRHKHTIITSIPSGDKDIKAIININDVNHNIQYLKKLSGTDIMAVLKADAYGHGLIEMAKIVRKLGVKHIGVATLGEAILLRKSGDKGRILAWLYDIYGEEIKEAINLDIDIAIFDQEFIPKFVKLIPDGKAVRVTMFIDTGINRAAIPYEYAIQACKDVKKSPKFEIVGLMSHLVCSNVKDSPIVNEQLRKFRSLRADLANIGIVPPLVHIANTGACLNYDVSDFTIARVGSGIVGFPGTDLTAKEWDHMKEQYQKNNSSGVLAKVFGKNKKKLDDILKIPECLKLVMSVKSNIIQLKYINKGDGVGYFWKFIAPKKMRIAILPVGYSDIIPRAASLKTHVYLNGTKRRVLGLINMDQIIIEARKSDKLNDEVFIFGNGMNCPQTIYDIGKEANMLVLEVLCNLGYRVNRVYE
jgi:alanine racemase